MMETTTKNNDEDSNTNDNDSHKSKKIDDKSYEQQKREWISKQLEIGKRVVVYPDQDDDAAGEDENYGCRDRRRFVSCRCQLVEVKEKDKKKSSSSSLLYGGVDISFASCEDDPSVAVYVVLDCADLDRPRLVYCDHTCFTLSVPYIPSFLAFREIDPLKSLIEKQMRTEPNLTPSALLVDGNGTLHERTAGIACCLGVQLDIPTVGVGKTLYNYRGYFSKAVVSRGVQNSLRDAVAAVGRGDDEGIPQSTSSSSSSSSASNNAKKKDAIIFDRVGILAPTMGGKENESGDDGSDDSIVDEEKKESNIVDEEKKESNNYVRQLASHCRGVAIPLRVPGNALLSKKEQHNNRQAETANDMGEEEKEGQKDHNKKEHDAATTVLAYALVGHGGGVGRNSTGRARNRQRRKGQPQQRQTDSNQSIGPIDCSTSASGGGSDKKRRDDAAASGCLGITANSYAGADANADVPVGTKVPIYVSVGHKMSFRRAVTIVASLSHQTRIPEPVRQADLIGRELLRQKERRKQKS